MGITFGPSTRTHQPGWLSGAVHFVIIAIAFQAESGEVWPYALLAMSAVSFFAWVANYRRYRHIQDLPTSKVASAAQGYVELFGRTELLPGEPIVSKLSRSPSRQRPGERASAFRSTGELVETPAVRPQQARRGP